VSRLDRFCLLACALALALAPSARALPPEPKDWEVQATFYGWLASIEGRVEARGISRDFDVKFRDILDDLGWAVMGNVEGRYKRALLIVDTLGMQVVSEVDDGPRTRPFSGPFGFVNGELTVGGFDLHTRLTTWAIDNKLGFRVFSTPLVKLTGKSPEESDLRRFDLDLFAGARYWRITNKTNLDIDPAALTVNGTPTQIPGVLPDLALRHGVRVPGALLNGADTQATETVDWVDPIVGLRVRADLLKRWSLFVLGDVGGWNIGNASDLTWQAMLGSQFHVSERWGFQTGYRALGVDRNSTFESTILHGPEIGVFVRF
jgi:hypothetical protein